MKFQWLMQILTRFKLVVLDYKFRISFPSNITVYKWCVTKVAHCMYCLDGPYSLVVRVDLSALLRVMFPCVFCHFRIWCPLSEVIFDCIDS